MANSPQSRKRARQSITRTAHNKAIRTATLTSIKKVRSAIDAKEPIDKVNELFKSMQSRLAKTAKSNIMHKNKAARITSRVNTKMKKAYAA